MWCQTKVGGEGMGGLEEVEGAGVGGGSTGTVVVDLAQDLEESNRLKLDNDYDYNPQLEETDIEVDSEDVSLDDEDDGMINWSRWNIFKGGLWWSVALSYILRWKQRDVSISLGCSCEDDERNLKFFIHHLKTLLQNTKRGDNWCIISDRHKVNLGIKKACTDLWPTVGRRFCCKHLSVNFKNVFPGPKMWQLFWLAASVTSPFTFGKVMKQIQKNKDAARIWLANLGDQSRWSKHKFVESFNSTLGVDRSRPILTLLEGLDPHTYVHGWYSVKRHKMAYGSAINVIPDKQQWPETTLPAIEPPVFKRDVGRPAKAERVVKRRKKKAREAPP
ncbi:Pleckstrin homology-like domain family B member 2 [Bienertia sinuspersici]